MTINDGIMPSEPVWLCNGTDKDDKPIEIVWDDGTVEYGKTPRQIDEQSRREYEAAKAVMAFLFNSGGFMQQFNKMVSDFDNKENK